MVFDAERETNLAELCQFVLRASLGPIEATTFRRRAAELELEAWAIAVRAGADVALAA